MMRAVDTVGLLLAIWFASALAAAVLVSIAWHFVRPRIEGWHAIDRGRAVLALAAATPIAATLVVFLVLSPGLLGLLGSGLDHCGFHSAHAHLCLVHPSAALADRHAMILAALAGVTLAALGRSCWLAWRRSRPLRALARTATGEVAPGVELVPLERPLALTFGLVRARSLVSTGLVRSLGPQHAQIVFEHEAEHARRRDPLRQLVARMSSVWVWPRVRRELLSQISLCAEQVCDERSVRSHRDRVGVAQAILAVERLFAEAAQQTSTSGLAASVPLSASVPMAGSSVAVRVGALLIDAPRRRGGWWALAGLLFVLLCLAAYPLHHEVEHLLAWLSSVG